MLVTSLTFVIEYKQISGIYFRFIFVKVCLLTWSIYKKPLRPFSKTVLWFSLVLFSSYCCSNEKKVVVQDNNFN